MNQILLVDDDPEFSYLTEQALKKCRPGCHLDIISISTDLPDWLKTHKRPGLILLDINMPNSNGFEVLNILKQNSRFRTIPVVMYTSSDRKEDVQKAYNNGANAYLIKPAGFEDLKNQLSEVSSYWFDIVKIHGPSHKTHDTKTWYDDLN